MRMQVSMHEPVIFAGTSCTDASTVTLIGCLKLMNRLMRARDLRQGSPLACHNASSRRGDRRDKILRSSGKSVNSRSMFGFVVP